MSLNDEHPGAYDIDWRKTFLNLAPRLFSFWVFFVALAANALIVVYGEAWQYAKPAHVALLIADGLAGVRMFTFSPARKEWDNQKRIEAGLQPKPDNAGPIILTPPPLPPREDDKP